MTAAPEQREVKILGLSPFSTRIQNKVEKMAKNLTLKDCNAERAEMLVREIGKVRCWLTGFAAARNAAGQLQVGVPGEDSLRQIQIILKDSIAANLKPKGGA